MQYKVELEPFTYEEEDNFLGVNDTNLKFLMDFFHVRISCRNNIFLIEAEQQESIDVVEKAIRECHKFVKSGKQLKERELSYICRAVQTHEEVELEKFDQKVVGRRLDGKPVTPKTKGQYEFVQAMEEKPIVFAIGPAGTGKTFLAVTEAVSALKRGDVKRIVLTRPAVEAGENLGFLPGDLKEKVDPYLTPLYDALHAMLGNEQTDKLMEKGTIEIAPLAYMRGRTLNDAYVILDEAQNTTKSQMKMFLTRFGFHSHMIITGDITQIDLAKNVDSGLIHATKVLRNLNDIAILHLSANDVVRHPLVQKMIESYEKYDS